MSEAVVETHGLRKRFGAKLAVADLSLSLGPGEIFGFLGPNGAGKTTSLKMLLGLVEPSGGEGRLMGAPLGDHAARAKVGFLPEHFRFQDWLTGRELLRAHGRLYGRSGADLERRVDALLERVDLVDAAHVRLRDYSKGMQQRAGLAATLLNDPAVVFLDEPTSGLDPLGRRLVRDLMRELKTRGVTVFLNSHLLGEVEQTCDRVVFLKAGRVVREHVLGGADLSIDVEVRAEGLGPPALEALARLGEVRAEPGGLLVRVAGPEAVPELARVVVGAGAKLHHLATRRTSLEAMFLEVMGEEGRPG
jgi:ABC-2 type transport system ATP-binding protein